MPNEITHERTWEEAYADIRGLAERFLRRERPDHTLQPTALAHEAYLRCQRDPRARDLAPHTVLRVAARAMRDILVEHARRHRAGTRVDRRRRVPLDDALAAYEDRALNLLDLDEALQRLEELDPDVAQLVELRFFGGLTEEECAQALEVSSRTLRRRGPSPATGSRGSSNDDHPLDDDP